MSMQHAPAATTAHTRPWPLFLPSFRLPFPFRRSSSGMQATAATEYTVVERSFFLEAASPPRYYVLSSSNTTDIIVDVTAADSITPAMINASNPKCNYTSNTKGGNALQFMCAGIAPGAPTNVAFVAADGGGCLRLPLVDWVDGQLPFLGNTQCNHTSKLEMGDVLRLTCGGTAPGVAKHMRFMAADGGGCCCSTQRNNLHCNGS